MMVRTAVVIKQSSFYWRLFEEFSRCRASLVHHGFRVVVSSFRCATKFVSLYDTV